MEERTVKQSKKDKQHSAFEMNVYTEVVLLSSINVKRHKNFIYFPFRHQNGVMEPGKTKSQAFQVC